MTGNERFEQCEPTRVSGVAGVVYRWHEKSRANNNTYLGASASITKHRNTAGPTMWSMLYFKSAEKLASRCFATA